jgi:hypothetical protein
MSRDPTLTSTCSIQTILNPFTHTLTCMPAVSKSKSWNNLGPDPGWLLLQAPRRIAMDGRHRRSVSLGVSDGASDPATPQDGTSDEAWEYEGPHDVVRALLT